MHYIRIAIAVAVWVSVWNLSIKEKKKIFDESKKWFKKLWWICWFLLKRCLVLAIIWWVIYLSYLWVKMIDWKWVWNIILWIILYCSPAIAFWILIFIGVWLDKKRQKRKNRINDKKREETKTKENLERLGLWEHEINEEGIIIKNKKE